MNKLLDRLIFGMRWILYPVNIGLIGILLVYVSMFLYSDYHFIRYDLKCDMESLMVALLGFVDAAMVSNLIVMVVQGTHQIFIRKLHLGDRAQSPQYLDHIDSGILKVKISLSISSITLVQILKDFVNIEKVEWSIIMHRLIILGACLTSALMMSLIWRVTHPITPKGEHHA